MAAAYSNSLQALNGIYGVLDIIVQKMSTTNTPQAQQEKAQNDVKTLNKGGLDGVKETPAKEKSGEITGVKASITVSEISAALLSLPPAIKAVSKLGGATTNKAVRVITGLANAFSFLAENKDSKNGAIALKNITDALNIFQELKIIPLAFKLTILDKLNVGKKIGAVLGDIVEGYKRGSGLSKKEAEAFSIVVSCTTNMTEFVENFAKLRKKMPRFKASVDAFVPVFEKLVKTIEKTPEESKVKAAAAATKMVAEFAKGSGIVIAEVVAIAVAIKAVGAQAIWIGLGVVAATLTLLTGLTLLVNFLAGKSRNSIKSMENVVNICCYI